MVIERRILLPAGPEEAWAAVLDFAAWFCDEAAVARVLPGARAEFRWADGTSRAAVFEEVDAPRLVTFRWLPFARDPEGAAIARPHTRVAISLASVDGGVEVAVVEQRLDEFVETLS
ncbi:MAG: SRPBCC domain-containing protein [Actinomycetota bacterium]